MLRFPRKTQCEYRSFTSRAVHFDTAAKGICQMLNNSQSEPRAARATASRFINAIEPLKNTRQLLRADADAVVFHFKHYFLCFVKQPDLHFPAFFCVNNGVIDQVDNNLF